MNHLIKTYNLQPADAVELVSKQAGFPKHYAVFLGMEMEKPYFVANLSGGVQLIYDDKLTEFSERYEVSAIERHNGSIRQRKAIVERALSRLGEKAYNLIFNNCEHFKNWVLYGESTSKQVEVVGTSMLASGISLLLLGVVSEKKGLQKAGLYLLIAIVVIVLIAILFYEMKEDYSEGKAGLL